MRLAGSYLLLLLKWMKECGAKLGSQESNEYEEKLMSGEFSKLVANGY